MTKVEYVLFLVTAGERLDRPGYVESNTGYAVGSKENNLICEVVAEVSDKWVRDGRPSAEDFEV